VSKPGKMKPISRTSAVLLPACIFLLCLLVSSGCIEKMALPSEIDTDDIEFSAGDTTYLLLSPIWDESYGFQTPIEISIAQDGHIFVADSAAHSIFVLKQDGDVLPEFQSLHNISIENNVVSPIDVDIDKKMNVFFIDGSNKVYVWNQYWNDVGIDSLLVDSKWEKMDVLSDSLLYPHVFFDGENPDHNFSDQWFETEESKFSGISAPGDNSDFIYVTDAYHNRIIRIDFYKTYYLKLSTGEEVWAHEGHFGETVTEYGTGAGYVNQPLSIDVNKDGDIYYSQSGDFFNLHQIQPKTEGDYSIYPFAVEWEGNDIMDTTRFFYPEDIAVDQNQMVYIANTDAQEIQVFNSHGDFFKKAGVEYITVDTTITIFTSPTDSSIVDTFYTKEIKGILEKPRAVTVDSRGVIYICDTPSSSIFRYRLSNQLDENLNPIP
jgi:hypothetical protein|tara:strand:+ start:250 stop:1551 length:1302 start_codon:yes stop_codon:yes gene_type:complete